VGLWPASSSWTTRPLYSPSRRVALTIFLKKTTTTSLWITPSLPKVSVIFLSFIFSPLAAKGNLKTVNSNLNRTIGLYCVMFHTYSEKFDFDAKLNIQNPYGNLPGEEYPYLPVSFFFCPRILGFLKKLILFYYFRVVLRLHGSDLPCGRDHLGTAHCVLLERNPSHSGLELTSLLNLVF